MTDHRTPLSPERAARRAAERADLALITQIAERFVAGADNIKFIGNPPNPRQDVVIKLIQVNGQARHAGWLSNLRNSPEDFFTDDMRGLFVYTNTYGDFSGAWRPRSMS